MYMVAAQQQQQHLRARPRLRAGPAQQQRLRARPARLSAGPEQPTEQQQPTDVCHERTATFSTGDLFYRPASRLIRDLGVLALAVLHEDRASAGGGGAPLKILDAMSGSGVRALRYTREAGGACHVHANERMFGEHPLRANLASLVQAGECRVTDEDAVDLYLRARLDGARYDLVDADGFGTGQPHLSEAWWAVKSGGLLYLCATDSCTTAGQNAHKCTQGYAASARHFPACNEQGLRLLLGASWREAAARNLHAEPVFSYFHPVILRPKRGALCPSRPPLRVRGARARARQPSSSFRVMLRLAKPKRPPADAYRHLRHVARCVRCGETWAVPSDRLDMLASAEGARGCCAGAAGEEQLQVMGPMWVGPMHDGDFVARMQSVAERREWADAAALLATSASARVALRCVASARRPRVCSRSSHGVAAGRHPPVV